MKKPNTIKALASIAVVLIIIIAIILSSPLFKPVKKDVIKIGVILPLSGVAADQGENQRQAIELAFQDKENIDGKHLELIFEDDESSNSPSKAVTITRKLIDVDNVHFIIGPIMSAEIEAASRIVNDEDVIMIAFGAVSSPFSRFGKNVFTTSPSFASESDEMIVFMKEHNLKKIAFIGVNTDAGLEIKQTLERELPQQGISLVSADLINLGVNDFRDVLTKAQQRGPDALYVWHVPALTGIMIRQAKELGLNTTILSFRNIEDPSASVTAGDALDGVIYTAPGRSESRENFIFLFKQKHGSEPNVFSDSAYDAANLLVEAIKAEGVDNIDGIREYLEEIEDYPGAAGILSFDSEKNVQQDFMIKTIKDGESVKYEE